MIDNNFDSIKHTIGLTIYKIYLKIFLIGCMVFFIPGQQTYVPQEMFFQNGIIGLIAISSLIPRQKTFYENSDSMLFYMGLIVLYAIVNTILWHYDALTRIHLLNLVLGFIFIKILTESDMNGTFLVSIGRLLAIFCSLNLVLLALQIHDRDPIFSPMFPQNMPQIDQVGFMGIKAFLGVLAVFSLPFLILIGKWQWIICLPLLYFSKSSTAVVAFLVTALFLLWFRHRKLFWMVVTFALVAGVWYVCFIDAPTGQFKKRLYVWLAGTKYLAGSLPWYGHGLAGWIKINFATIQNNGQPQLWTWAHNEWLQYLFEQGIIGAIFLYAYFKNFFNKVRLELKDHQLAVSLMLSVMMVSVCHFPFHVGRLAAMACFMIGVSQNLIRRSPITELPERSFP